MKSVPLVATPEFAEQHPALSPNGQWLAYSSNETGQPEIFVRPFPNVNESKHSVSTDGGIGPLWARSGRELFFVSGNAMVAATIETEPEFRVVNQDTLFTIPPGFLVSNTRFFYDVAPDDQRFLMGRTFQAGGGDGGAPVFTLVQNFFEELRLRVPN